MEGAALLQCTEATKWSVLHFSPTLIIEVVYTEGTRFVYNSMAMKSVSPPIPVAIKAVVRSKLTTKLLENLESEIRLLKGIKQRNVVELLDCLVR